MTEKQKYNSIRIGKVKKSQVKHLLVPSCATLALRICLVLLSPVGRLTYRIGQLENRIRIIRGLSSPLLTGDDERAIVVRSFVIVRRSYDPVRSYETACFCTVSEHLRRTNVGVLFLKLSSSIVY